MENFAKIIREICNMKLNKANILLKAKILKCLTFNSLFPLINQRLMKG